MAKQDLQRLAQKVLDRRLELGFSSQRDACAAADIGTTTWSQMESGTAAPKSPRVKRQIAAVLQWPPDAVDLILRGVTLETEQAKKTMGQRLTALVGDIEQRMAELVRDLNTAKQMAQFVEDDHPGWPDESSEVQ